MADENEELEEEYTSILIVEDGTGKTDSNSFVSVAFADKYLSVRMDSWETLELKDKEKNLILATDYINSVFKWKGQKKTAEQSLAFPRKNLVDNDGYKVEGIPMCLQYAVCDAVKELEGKSTLFKTESDKGDVASESIGGAISLSYFEGSKKTNQTLYEAINSRLRGLYEDSSKKQVVVSRIVR